MKFILLTSGPIGTELLRISWFVKELSSNLCGLISCENFQIEFRQISNKKINIVCHKLNSKKKNEIELEKLINATKPHYIFSIQYPWIISKNILNLVDGKVLNLHNAKLPNYRGHNSISHEILNDERLHTTSLHWVSEKVDQGYIVSESQIQIRENETAISLHKRSIVSAISLIKTFFKTINSSNKLPSGELIIGNGTYFSKEIDNFKVIPPGSSISEIYKYSRAFYYPPHEPAYFIHRNKKIYVSPECFSSSFD